MICTYVNSIKYRNLMYLLTNVNMYNYTVSLKTNIFDEVYKTMDVISTQKNLAPKQKIYKQGQGKKMRDWLMSSMPFCFRGFISSCFLFLILSYQCICCCLIRYKFCSLMKNIRNSMNGWIVVRAFMIGFTLIQHRTSLFPT